MGNKINIEKKEYTITSFDGSAKVSVEKYEVLPLHQEMFFIEFTIWENTFSNKEKINSIQKPSGFKKSDNPSWELTVNNFLKDVFGKDLDIREKTL